MSCSRRSFSTWWKRLKKTDASPSAKVLKLGKALAQAAAAQAGQQPYLVPIGERAEAVLEAYDDRRLGTQEALRELEKLLAEFVQAGKERDKTGFDLNTFTLYHEATAAERGARGMAR